VTLGRLGARFLAANTTRGTERCATGRSSELGQDLTPRRPLALAEASGQDREGGAPSLCSQARVREGIDLYQGLKTPPVFSPTLRALEAGAYAQAGRVDEGLTMVDEALEITGRRSGTTRGTLPGIAHAPRRSA